MAVAATGFFDGVHLGHRLVLETLLVEAEKRDGRSLVVTFWPHPRIVLGHGSDSLRLLSTRQERLSLLESLSPSEVVEMEFDGSFAAMTAGEYLALLKEKYSVSAVVVGYDTKLGCDLKGPSEIGELATQLGMECVRVPEFGAAVSSTRIRRALSDGDVAGAASMLGYRYPLCGYVGHGNKIGRTIGFPTANLDVDEPLKALPGAGAYLCEVMVGGSSYYGMTNVGRRPTVAEDGATVVETNIFGFNGDIYGEWMELRFIARVRGEKKFSSLEDLRRQLVSDRNQCTTIISTL